VTTTAESLIERVFGSEENLRAALRGAAADLELVERDWDAMCTEHPGWWIGACNGIVVGPVPDPDAVWDALAPEIRRDRPPAIRRLVQRPVAHLHMTG
jgi:hypothetical protein